MAWRDELIERFDLDPAKRFRAYSKGNRQKVAIIAALQHRPRLALLDEPTSGLDPLHVGTLLAVFMACAVGGLVVFRRRQLTF